MLQMETRNRPNQELLVPDWLITSQVTQITSSDWLFTVSAGSYKTLLGYSSSVSPECLLEICIPITKRRAYHHDFFLSSFVNQASCTLDIYCADKRKGCQYINQASRMHLLIYDKCI
eukprot:sb/3476519/